MNGRARARPADSLGITMQGPNLGHVKAMISHGLVWESVYLL
jgi:hypothetical protein